jgi:adenosylmethionine---8-amino-7-oxononanoate aminotransferase
LGDLKRRFIEAGVFVRPFGKIVYLTPAFTIGEEDLARLTSAVVSVLKDWTRG